MTAMQRRKGQAGERELAGLIRDHLGLDVRRRVRQHDGDSDLEGGPAGWSIEVKRRAGVILPSDIAAWWRQACAQAGDLIPVLFFRADRRDWRAVWPLAIHLVEQHASMWGDDLRWAVEGSIEGWCAAAREIAGEAGACQCRQHAPDRPRIDDRGVAGVDLRPAQESRRESDFGKTGGGGVPAPKEALL